MTKKQSAIRIPHSAFVWTLFALVIVLVYFFALGSLPLVGPDEPRYAQVAREMFERGDWITPTLGGANWFEKPVLLYWLQIISYKLFGVSEFAARSGSALFGFGTILSLWILGKFGEKNESKTGFANWLALIAASSIGLLVFSRGASFDIILTFPITASLISFFIFDSTQRARVKQADTNISASPRLRVSVSLFLFYFFIGVSLLAKGLVGIVFPFAIVAFYYLLSRRFPDKKFLFSLIWGTLLSLLVAGTWYLPMYQTHGWKFIDEFFIQHHFARYTSNKYQHPQPFYFFLWVLPLMTIPWLPFFLLETWKNLKNFKSAIRDPQSAFAIAWLLVPLVFFSFSGSKLPGYILPALPAALILTADSIWRFVHPFAMTNSDSFPHRVEVPRRKHAMLILAFLTFAVVAFLLQFVAPKYAEANSVKNLIESANAKGNESEKITNLFTVSHNAEFYAAGRLVRDADGKLKRYDDFLVLVNEMKAENAWRILVLVPHPNTKDITESPLVEAEVLGDTGDTAIVLVKPK